MKVKDIGTGNEISKDPPYFMKANALSNTISDLVTIEPENYPSYEADYKIELIMPNSKIPEDKNELKSSSTDLKKKNINIKRSIVPRRSPIPRKAKESPRQEEKKTITLIRNPKRKPRQASNNKSTSKKNSRTIRKIDKNNDSCQVFEIKKIVNGLLIFQMKFRFHRFVQNIRQKLYQCFCLIWKL